MSSPRAVRQQRAALLAIGDEVLRGEISNTNAAFIAERLFEAGYELAEQTVVSDDPQAIRTALVRLRAEMDVIIATGGLGPTEDDRTVDVVAELLVTGTSPDEPSLDAMKKRFSTHGFELTPNNLRQVRIPNGAKDRHGRRVLPARRAARDGEDVHRRGDAPAGAAADGDGRAAAGDAHLAPVRDG
jgi:molybdenum cofactor synthesis domain-containing protein